MTDAALCHMYYEACVQSPQHAVPLLRAIHGDSPRVLGEDFAGTCAVSRHWVETDPEARAICVDLDDATLRFHHEHERIERITGDVRTGTSPTTHASDVVFVGNFSIGEIHSRSDLVAYLRHCKARTETLDGVFVCDTYGGESAYIRGSVQRHHPHPTEPGAQVRYTWEQREADPLTGRVLNALHFRTEKAGVISDEVEDAFIYDWRLWSVPELRDAMHEAGFRTTQVYSQLPDAQDDDGRVYIRPVEDPNELDETFIVLVAAR
ncbi:MAG: hypothetical protein AAGG07_11280 [Planctomycetota bacterium]